MNRINMSNENSFLFTWEIENFSLFQDLLPSPIFTVEMLGGSKWFLDIYHRRNPDIEYISCYLSRDNDQSSSREITIDFRIDMIGGNGKTLRSFEDKGITFTKGGNFCNDYNIEVRELEREMQNWPKNALTIYCCITPSQKKIGCRAKTQVCHDWYSKILKIQTKNFNSPVEATYLLDDFENVPPVQVTFTTSGDDMLINLQSPECISSSDPASGSVHSRFISCKITLLNNKGDENSSRSSTFLLNKNKWQFPTFIKKSFLRQNENTLLKDKSLKLKIVLCLSNGKEIGKIENYTSSDSSSTDSRTTALKNFGEMFLGHKHSDVKLQAHGKTFPCHKCILSARSAVFDTMFCQDMLENQTGVVDIPGIDADILKYFLQFIYTGEVNMVSYEQSAQLLGLAEKYQIQSLKKECSSYLQSVLNIENACEVLDIGDLVSYETLKSSALDYIVTNAAFILPSQEWSEWVKSNVTLATEVYSKLTNKLELKPN